MCYSRQEDLLGLAALTQVSAVGLSITDIERAFNVSCRTAERMRDAVLRAYPQLEELSGPHGQKYWRFPPGIFGKIVEPAVDELAAGHRAASTVRREGDLDTAEALVRLLVKAQEMFHEDRRRRVATDLEAQLLADGVAFHPCPRERIATETMAAMREAILAGVMISAEHRARG